MAEQELDYNEYGSEGSGRLFTSAMFGFNKEEVLEYLEEMADENVQRQETDERRIQELTQRIKALEATQSSASFFPESQPDPAAQEELFHLRGQLEEAKQTLEITKAATQQSAEELQVFREQLHNAQQENAWLRNEYAKYEQAYNQMAQQLQELSEGQHGISAEAIAMQQQLQMQLHQADSEMQSMRQQLQKYQNEQQQLQHAEEEIQRLRQQLQQQQTTDQEFETLKQQLQQQQQNSQHLQQAAAEIQNLQNSLQQLQYEKQQLQQQYEQRLLQQQQQHAPNETTLNAQQAASAIIAEANAEADRILDGVKTEKERMHRQMRTSAGGLVESIHTLRGELSTVEGNVSNVLESVQLTLNDIMTALARTEQNLSTFGVQVERFPNSAAPVQGQSFYPPLAKPSTSDPMPAVQQPQGPAPRREAPARKQQSASAGSNVRPFRPTYSSSPTASGGWPQTAEAYQLEEEETEDVRLRNLSDSLVDTLRQMMN